MELKGKQPALKLENGVRSDQLKRTTPKPGLQVHIKAILDGRSYVYEPTANSHNEIMQLLDAVKHPVTWINYAPRLAQDFSDILPMIEQKVRTMITLGKEPGLVFDACKHAVDLFIKAEDLSEALYYGHLFSQKKSTVLIAPGAKPEDRDDATWQNELESFIQSKMKTNE